jgi:beta-lactamase superfamily II metal-dependent hydrolase
MKSSQLIATIICLSLILIVAGCTDSTDTPSEQPTTTAQNTFTPSGQNLTVHFLDVGQGDMTMTHHIL